MKNAIVSSQNKNHIRCIVARFSSRPEVDILAALLAICVAYPLLYMMHSIQKSLHLCFCVRKHCKAVRNCCQVLDITPLATPRYLAPHSHLLD